MLVAVRLLLDSLRRRGVRGTLRRLRRIVTSRREARRTAQADRAFDAQRGVDTAIWVRVPELDTDSPNRRFAVRYQPSSLEEFELLMGKLKVDHREFSFVDYGSGKGRVLMLAAAYPFRRVLGVEFSESLDRVARDNIATLGPDAGRIETVVMDATEFAPPAGPLVLYFFNPFGPPVLRPVLERARASLEGDPRPAYVVLTGPPELAPVVDAAGFERVDVDELGWLTRGVWTRPYS
jgi:SAM-dependent methyltransferase